jgi:hypothetical protein
VSISAAQSTGTLNDYNPYDVSIPDAGVKVCSDLNLAGAPPGAAITKVKVYYEIEHPYPADLDVWMTCYAEGQWHDYQLHYYGSSSSVASITLDNLHTWDGLAADQEWFLCAQDKALLDVGKIKFFELWVTYEYNQAPLVPFNESPPDLAAKVSISEDLDWSCVDPDGDTLYYTVYFEKGNPSPSDVIKADATGSSKSLGTLDPASKYYWKVKADDHNGGVSWSPVWDFTTEDIDASLLSVSVEPNPVSTGATAKITYSIQNTGDLSHSFGVGCEIRKDGALVADVGQAMTGFVASGGTTSGSFNFPIPGSWTSDAYTARAVVWSGTPGSSDWLGNLDQGFTVEAKPVLTGKLAFHRYTSPAVDPLAWDGELYLLDLATGGLSHISATWGLKHTINAHFSPDGCRLVFMATPSGSAEAWEEMAFPDSSDTEVEVFSELQCGVGMGSGEGLSLPQRGSRAKPAPSRLRRSAAVWGRSPREERGCGGEETRNLWRRAPRESRSRAATFPGSCSRR